MKHRGWKWTDRTRMAVVLAAALVALVGAGWTWDDRSVVWDGDGAWGSQMDWKPGVDAP